MPGSTADQLRARNNPRGFLHQVRLDFSYDSVQVIDIDLLHVIEHHGVTQISDRAYRSKESPLGATSGAKELDEIGHYKKKVQNIE